MAAVEPESPLVGLLDSVVRARRGLGTPVSVAVLEVGMSAGHMPPLHVHDQDEVLHVLEGGMLVHAGPERIWLSAGESYAAPAGVPDTRTRLPGRMTCAISR